MFIKTAEQTTQETVLTMIDTSTGYAYAVQCEQKGAGDKHALRQFRGFIKDIGYTGDLIIQTDPENSIQDVATTVAAGRGSVRTEVRETPVGSKESNGTIERFHRSLEAQIRTLKVMVEDKHGMYIGSKSILTPWLIRHAFWLLNRSNVGSDGKTPYERLKRCKYESAIVRFAEIVHAKGYKQEGSKMSEKWTQGVWLGRTIDSNMHIVACRKVSSSLEPSNANPYRISLI